MEKRGSGGRNSLSCVAECSFLTLETADQQSWPVDGAPYVPLSLLPLGHRRDREALQHSADFLQYTGRHAKPAD